MPAVKTISEIQTWSRDLIYRDLIIDLICIDAPECETRWHNLNHISKIHHANRCDASRARMLAMR
jgi:hypothetical protein